METKFGCCHHSSASWGNTLCVESDGGINLMLPAEVYTACISWHLWNGTVINVDSFLTNMQNISKSREKLIDWLPVVWLISSSPSKSCSLDPIPTSILKLCFDELTPVLTLIVNTSLEFADFSPELKRAFILPLLKKAIRDCEILKNFRPVSNLSFLSKLIERIVCVQLVDHLKINDLYEVYQSAYRQLHSTETALLCVQNDLLQAVDTHGGAILVLLDLSAAFDTIPTFGIRARAALSCVGGRNAGGYGCNSRVLCRPQCHGVAYMYIDCY